jgi:hypothetical protein
MYEMPVSGRAAVSSSSRHSRRTSQSGSDFQQYRREKTKSSQSYAQRPNRDSAPQEQNYLSAAGTTQAQRYSKSRALSAPLVPKAQPSGPDDGNTADNDASDSDPGEDGEIADDPFFQRFDPTASERLEEELKSPIDPHGSTDTETPLSPTSTQMRARPDSTAEPLGSPLSPRSTQLVRLGV